MFEDQDLGIGLLPGEGAEDAAAADQFAYELTCRELADGRVGEDRHFLPDVESVPPGPFLSAILGSVDRSRLNGFDLVRSLQARERLVAHCQAGSMGTPVRSHIPRQVTPILLRTGWICRLSLPPMSWVPLSG